MSSSVPHHPKDIPLDDPTALTRFGNLEMVARLLVEGYMMGLHKSPFKGASVEFVEHRQYYPGDEIRHIDWRAYGKTGRYYVKEFEDETSLRCYLIVDASGSMGYAGRTISKFDYARYLSAALGYLLLSQRDATGLVTFDTKIRDRMEPSANAQSFRRLVHTLDDRHPGGETSIAKVFEQLLPIIRRRSLIVIFSDCFDRLDALTDALKQFRHSRHEVIVFQIVTPEEEDFPFSRPTQFHSLERTGHRKLVDPHQLRTHYRQRYTEFCRELARGLAGIGVDYQKVLTSEPYHMALGTFLSARAARKNRR